MMKAPEVIRAIEQDGWRFHSQKGSHRQYVHPTKRGRVTVAGKPGIDLNPKTLAYTFRQAQLARPKE